jgi:lactate racemase
MLGGGIISPMKKYSVPQLAWFGPKEFEFSLPDKWQVEMCYSAGYNRPALKPEEIRTAVKNPIGMKPLRELARGKKEVVIVFDDMSRVTRVAKIVPYVLEELTEAGVADSSIQFICGEGTHPVIYRSDFVKKLGEDVVSRFRCFNHNPFGNCVFVGTTNTYKTRLCINEEYAKSDLKIVIGACVPHGQAGFGGGSKMVMPGISSYESIYWNHVRMFAPPPAGVKPTQGMGLIDENVSKKDLDECAEIAGIDFLVNAVVNLWGESTAIFAGDWKQSFAAAVKEAKPDYRTPRVTGKDIIISNAYAKSNEAGMGLGVALPMLKGNSKAGTDVVILANAPEGQIPHYLLGRWGKTSAGLLVNPGPLQCPSHVNQILVYSEYPHPGSSWWAEDPRIKYLSRWDQVLQALQKFHGENASVAIIPDATNQYFE